MRQNRLFLPAALLASLATPFAVGQDQADIARRLERQMRDLDAQHRLRVPTDQPISERMLFDYGGSLRFGFLSADNATGQSRTLRQTDGVLFLRAELDGAHRFYGRLRFLYDDYNSGDSFDGDGDELDVPIGDRYWYQFDLRGQRLARTGEYTSYNLNIKTGRQFIHWGSGLALSEDLYAALLEAEYGQFAFSGLAGLTPSSGTIDFDGSRPGFDDDTDRAFFGARFEYRGLATHRPYVSVLVQRDHNERNSNTFSSGGTPFPTRFNYDSEYYAFGSAGSLGAQLTYRAELVHERGRGLSNSFDSVSGAPVTQTEEDIDAWAGILTLAWLYRDSGDTRLEFEFIGGSGDGDRFDASDTFGGNQTGTSDHSFNSLGYVNTGLALAPEVANLLAWRIGASTSPLPDSDDTSWLRVGVNGFLFAKADSAAPLNINTNNSTFIGGEVDLFVDWRITSDLIASVRYGLFLPGDAMPAGEDDPRHFFYAGVTYAF